MAFKPCQEKLGITADLTEVGTTQLWPLGTIIEAVDPTYGAGEFIYLKGVASTVAGSIVNYKGTTWQTALGYAGENVPSPLAIAMGACVAGHYGWYQIGGIAIAAKACTVSFAAAAKVAVGSSSGLAVASLSGQEIMGAFVSAVASATAGRVTVALVINRPHNQGRVS